MTRVAIYARFSTDRQNEKSAEDQARLCRDRAEREGWDVIDVFADLALSGASRNRPGLNALLDQLHSIDIVLAEAVDRISRDQEDIANIWKRLRFAGVRLVTLSEGEVGQLHVGMSGTMAAMQLTQIAEKTRRGQVGRVAAGRIPGGLSYGYALVPGFDASGRPDRGRRTIIEDQATIVRRIFAEYLAGLSPRQIAMQLNEERVPAPSGRRWGASTIAGNQQRGVGILHNALYDGRIVYNRQRWEKHPETRQRIARPNPQSEWRFADVPDLAIVDRAVWTQVERRWLGTHGERPERLRRPKRLLSGLIKCSVCHGGFTVIGRETWGCSAHREGRGCTNNRTISTGQLEGRIIGALSREMLAPEVVAEYLAERHREGERDRRRRIAARSTLERRRTRATRQIERLIDSIADGHGSVVELGTRMRACAAERDRLAAEIEEIDADNVIALHPAAADRMRQQLENLADAVSSPTIEAAETRALIRNIVGQVNATPRETGRGLDLQVTGNLAAILNLTQKSRPPSGPALMPTMVAGTGFEPVTFRL